MLYSPLAVLCDIDINQGRDYNRSTKVAIKLPRVAKKGKRDA